MVWPQSPTPLILCKPILAQVILTWAKLTTGEKGQIPAMLMDADQQARTRT